ncbi:hypothetical protein L1887_51779 [Cichorium endivia]|nr:hypothetical protein L1887_51779 [Cichorium endivia]
MRKRNGALSWGLMQDSVEPALGVAMGPVESFATHTSVVPAGPERARRPARPAGAVLPVAGAGGSLRQRTGLAGSRADRGGWPCSAACWPTASGTCWAARFGDALIHRAGGASPRTNAVLAQVRKAYLRHGPMVMVAARFIPGAGRGVHLAGGTDGHVQGAFRCVQPARLDALEQQCASPGAQARHGAAASAGSGRHFQLLESRTHRMNIQRLTKTWGRPLATFRAAVPPGFGSRAADADSRTAKAAQLERRAAADRGSVWPGGDTDPGDGGVCGGGVCPVLLILGVFARLACLPVLGSAGCGAGGGASGVDAGRGAVRVVVLRCCMRGLAITGPGGLGRQTTQGIVRTGKVMKRTAQTPRDSDQLPSIAGCTSCTLLVGDRGCCRGWLSAAITQSTRGQGQAALLANGGGRVISRGH